MSNNFFNHLFRPRLALSTRQRQLTNPHRHLTYFKKTKDSLEEHFFVIHYQGIRKLSRPSKLKQSVSRRDSRRNRSGAVALIAGRAYHPHCLNRLAERNKQMQHTPDNLNEEMLWHAIKGSPRLAGFLSDQPFQIRLPLEEQDIAEAIRLPESDNSAKPDAGVKESAVDSADPAKSTPLASHNRPAEPSHLITEQSSFVSPEPPAQSQIPLPPQSAEETVTDTSAPRTSALGDGKNNTDSEVSLDSLISALDFEISEFSPAQPSHLNPPINHDKLVTPPPESTPREIPFAASSGGEVLTLKPSAQSGASVPVPAAAVLPNAQVTAHPPSGISPGAPTLTESVAQVSVAQAPTATRSEPISPEFGNTIRAGNAPKTSTAAPLQPKATPQPPPAHPERHLAGKTNNPVAETPQREAKMAEPPLVRPSRTLESVPQVNIPQPPTEISPGQAETTPKQKDEIRVLGKRNRADNLHGFANETRSRHRSNLAWGVAALAALLVLFGTILMTWPTISQHLGYAAAPAAAPPQPQVGFITTPPAAVATPTTPNAQSAVHPNVGADAAATSAVQTNVETTLVEKAPQESGGSPKPSPDPLQNTGNIKKQP